MYTVEEADAAMEPFFQKQKEAEKKICCWKDPDTEAVTKWFKAAEEYSDICYQFDTRGTKEEYREEYVDWAKENTQLNCPIHSKEMEE